MREIKFRAFHKPSKKMFDVVSIDFKNKVVFSYEQIIGFSKHPYFDDVSYNLKDCELMQYTGLKDNTKFNELSNDEKETWLKNNKKSDWKGKEIYEGDIVEVTLKEYYSNEQFTIDPDDEVKIIGKVIFDIFSYRIEFDDKTSIFLFEVDSNDIDIKILGNIYTNPDLLEVN